MNFLKLIGIFFICTNLAYADKINVLTSFSILKDLTEQVGGERVTVQSIVGPNQDAHIYQTTPNDLKKIKAAKLIIVNGLGFEGAGLNRAITQSKIKMVIASRGVQTLSQEHHHDDHSHGSTDPHAWTDPTLTKIYVKNIAQALSSIDPQGTDYYQKHATAYTNELTQLDNWAKQSFGAIAKNKRKVMTAHDAFGYFSHHYDIEFIAPQGVNTESEASAKTVAQMIRQAKAQNIKAIFAENIKDDRLIKQISKETGAKVQGKLYSDALSPKNTEADTYLKMMRFNINQLINSMK
ncbi:metal ABC transporter solute-binding protein, Zn/Mn family [Neisseria sp. Ec49-e6-T10]|uniref:metal ABC transporter solute-binding protein, Zn/Mn family n=1 Tax=Neisseria sp. Ec49-e6-T10 TaxID=3140744 RepID=UPI003EBD82C1